MPSAQQTLPRRARGTAVRVPTRHPSTDGSIDTPDRSSAPRRPTVGVVIPTLNEARNIGWVLRHLPPSVEEVVLVDGRSTDDTIAVARAIRPDIRVVLEPGRGKGRALRTGFAAATAEYVVMLDADGSMNPAEIDRYVELLAAGHDFVKGSRFMPGGGTNDMTLLRRLGNFGLLVTANMLYRRRFTDLCYGYCAFRRTSLAALCLDADGFEIETQIVVRAIKAGLVTTEMPSFEAPRIYGESNLSTFRDGWRVLRTILRERLVRKPGAVREPVFVRIAEDGFETIHALPVASGGRIARPVAVARPRATEAGTGPRAAGDEVWTGEAGVRLRGDRL